MKIAIILSVVLTLITIVASIKQLRGFKFEVRVITRIAIVSAITITLHMIKIVPFPQGGGFTLLSVLPIMILSTLSGIKEGIVCAIVVASIQIVIQPPYYPLQIPLDYFGSMIAIAFTPMLGTSKKIKLVSGGLLASIGSTFFSVLSGVIFFGQFAPEGMNTWLYSFIYNFSGHGVEAFLSVIVLTIIPLERLQKTLAKNI